jgi:radical SAM-linked protein
MQRIRIAYEKGSELQYTGNLDMHKVWERTFRRAHLPLAYSQGFHPQPRIQQAAPLPLGFTSVTESLDVWLDDDDPIDVITKKLVATAQPGIVIQQVSSIPLTEKALSTLVTAAVYEIVPDDAFDTVEFRGRMEKLLSTPSIDRVRRGKPYDLRPLIHSLTLEEGNPSTIKMELASLPSATGRPEEVLEELGIDPYSVDIQRLKLVFNR